MTIFPGALMSSSLSTHLTLLSHSFSELSVFILGLKGFLWLLCVLPGFYHLFLLRMATSARWGKHRSERPPISIQKNSIEILIRFLKTPLKCSSFSFLFFFPFYLLERIFFPLKILAGLLNLFLLSCSSAWFPL